MATIKRITLRWAATHAVYLGRRGENLARTIEIDATPMAEEFPGCTFALLAQRPTEAAAYAATVTEADGIVSWPITDADTGIAGSGRIELRAMLGDVVAKSVVMATVTDKSLDAPTDTDPPEPEHGWLDQALAAQAGAEAAAADAKETLATVEQKLADGELKGEKGDPGKDAEVTAESVEAALGYKPENEILQAQSDTAVLGDELVSTDGWTLGAGWSGDAQTGFTHAFGVEPLTCTMPENTQGNCYQISFKSSVAMTDSNLFVSIGNSPLFNLYYEEHADGTISVGVLATGTGEVAFVPSTTYKGTITDISVRRVLGTFTPIKQLLDTMGHASTEIYVTPQEQNNLYIGLNAGRTNTTGNRNVALGANALLSNLSGWRNIAIGSGALKANTAGTRNTAIGEDALSANQSGQRNIAIGTSTLTKITNSNRNIAIGADSMFAAENCDDCIAIGFGALNLNQGHRNYGIGTTTLYRTTGSSNVAIGYSAGYGITSGADNVSIGASALYRAKTGKNNTAIGAYALRGAENSDYSNYNVAIGYAAGQNIGKYSNNNVLIGANVAAALSGADYCIIIGAGQDADASENYQLNIGGLLRGSMANNAAYLQINGELELPKIPTADPKFAGRIWNDNGTLKVSTGGTTE